VTISPDSVRLGAQRPRVLHQPDRTVSSAGQEAAELAASAGLVLDEWQRFVLDVGLSERADGKWSAFEVGLIVPRQNGKGSVLEARELAGLFLFGERLILHSAHEFKTANEAFLRIRSLIERTPDLARKVKQIRQANEVSIETKSGARLLFVARSRGSGRGFSGDCVILDEAFNLGAEAMGALLPTLSAKPNPQIWYTSSAPMASSVQLHAVRRRAAAGGSPRLAFMEWSIDPDVDRPDDPGSWAKANPSFGIRIGEEFVRAEIDAMPPAEFARERLGVPDPEPVEDPPLFPLVEWNRLADPSSDFGGRVAFAVDVAPGAAWASIAMVGMRPDGLPHVELVERREGVDWVAARRRALDERWRPKFWVRDPSGPAVELAGKFRELKGREATEASVRLVTAVADGKFRWLCDEGLLPGLVSAVVGARRRDMGDGVWKWSRVGSDVDISPLVAMTWALWAGDLIAKSRPVLL